MTVQKSMLIVRVDSQIMKGATECLSRFGMTTSDAVRILLTRIAEEGGLPAGLTNNTESYDKWFRSKVREALAFPPPVIPRQQVMDETQTTIDE